MKRLICGEKNLQTIMMSQTLQKFIAIKVKMVHSINYDFCLFPGFWSTRWDWGLGPSWLPRLCSPLQSVWWASRYSWDSPYKPPTTTTEEQLQLLNGSEEGSVIGVIEFVITMMWGAIRNKQEMWKSFIYGWLWTV